MKGGLQRGHLGGDGHSDYLDCGYGSTGDFMSKNQILHLKCAVLIVKKTF